MASLIIWAPLVFFGGAFFIPAIIFVTLIGVWSIHSSLSQFSGSDPQTVVIDEVAGMGIALLCCPPSWVYVLTGFALFRLFDIAKPWPVSWADQKIKGTWGIMLDDLLAGAYACIILLLILKYAH